MSLEIRERCLQACVNNAIREIAASKFAGFPARCLGSREISSAPFFALGHARDARKRTTITNASRRACTRAYTRANERVHTPRSSAFPPRGRRSSNSRGRSKINGRGGYVRSLLAAVTASEGRRGRGRITAHALYLRCIPTANHPRTHVAA